LPLGLVYVLSNPAMPRLVKIGCTAQDDVTPRLNQLYSTGVPFPFEVEFAARVPNPEEVEQALHQAFAPNRVNPRREFFEIEPSQAIAILRLLHVEDATQEIEQLASAVEPQDAIAAERYRARRPPLNFVEMGIPIGSLLNFARNNTVIRVSAPKKVQVEDVEMSLTAATRQLLGVDHDVAPGPYWTFNGKSLRAIYDETYQREA
jgi:T5orf172 domain